MYSTKKQRENLRTLSDYLSTLDQEGFSMAEFRSLCGDVACAAGHGPAAGIGVDPGRGGDWHGYILANFGFNVGIQPEVWKWCFSAPWVRLDNTPRGAAKRIDLCLKDEIPEPLEVSDIFLGRASLPY